MTGIEWLYLPLAAAFITMLIVPFLDGLPPEEDSERKPGDW